MKDQIVEIGPGFWNIRGSLRIAGVLDIGTQMSLVRLSRGRFVLLDSYPLRKNVREKVLELTEGGKAICAILNLHPFHTLHVRTVAHEFPEAKLYGTERHIHRNPDLDWERTTTHSPELGQLFEDLVFSVPRGVEFIPDNQNLHFASVLAFHPASKTLHVDDTLTWLSVPFWGGLKFHPSLGRVLERRAGAVSEFRSWARWLVEQCKDVDQVCTAHMRSLPPSSPGSASVSELVQKALDEIEKKLSAHEQKFG